MRVNQSSPDSKSGAMFYRDSILLRGLYDRLCGAVGNDFVGLAFYVLLWEIGYIIVAAIEGTLLLSSPNIGLLQDYFYHSLLVVVFFLLWALKKLIMKFYDVFWREGGFQKSLNWKKITKEEYHTIIDQSDDFIQHRKFRNARWKGFFYLLRVGAVVYLLYRMYGLLFWPLLYDNWAFRNHPIGIISCLIFIFILLVVIGPEVIWRFIFVIFETRRIAEEVGKKKAIVVLPFSPDGAGGLKPLGSLALQIIFIPLSFMIPLVIWIFFREFLYQLVWIIGAVVGLLIISFFYPLGATSTFMKEAKDYETKRLSEELAHQYHILNERLEATNGTFDDECTKIVHRIQSLTGLYDTSKKMPVWPFDIETIIKFICLVIAPLLFIFIEHFIYK